MPRSDQRALFEATEEDALVMAQELQTRGLEPKEIDTVSQLLQWGFEGRQQALEDAVLKVEKVRKLCLWAQCGLVLQSILVKMMSLAQEEGIREGEEARTAPDERRMERNRWP